jgi:hypothetical protein
MPGSPYPNHSPPSPGTSPNSSPAASRHVVIVDGVSLRKHTLMQNAANPNSFTLLAIKHDMPTAFHSPQARTNIVALSPQRRIAGQPATQRFKIVEVTDGLRFAPSQKRIGSDIQQVGCGKP